GGGEVLAPLLECASRCVARLDGLRQANFVVLGQQRVLPDVGEVEPDEVFLVSLDTLLRQEMSFWCGLQLVWRSSWCTGTATWPFDNAGQGARIPTTSGGQRPTDLHDTWPVKVSGHDHGPLLHLGSGPSPLGGRYIGSPCRTRCSCPS